MPYRGAGAFDNKLRAGIYKRKPAIVGIAVAVLVAAAGIIQAIRFFRCPYCGCNLYLWGQGRMPEYCPDCGERLIPHKKS